jgi:hypothetical protein
LCRKPTKRHAGLKRVLKHFKSFSLFSLKGFLNICPLLLFAPYLSLPSANLWL